MRGYGDMRGYEDMRGQENRYFVQFFNDILNFYGKEQDNVQVHLPMSLCPALSHVPKAFCPKRSVICSFIPSIHYLCS
jgi:hypothetical protein